MKRTASVGAIMALLGSAGVVAQNMATDWPNVGHDPGGMKYSPLTQITPANVNRLVKTWTYDLGATANGYSVTPIVVNNVMYLPVGGSTIVALKADAGTEIWKTDLKAIPNVAGNPSAGGRGISYWPGGPGAGPRIVIATTNGFLVQLDARSGTLIPGPAGLINLSAGVMD